MKKFLCFLITIAIVSFIWWNSAQDAVSSTSISMSVTIYLLKVLEIFGQSVPAGDADHIIRKLAHFTEYMGLGLFLALSSTAALKNYGARILMALFLGLVIANIDEYIQIFSYGRSSKIQDVGIDFIGVIVGCYLGIKLGKKIFHSYSGRSKRLRA